jgi:hypothetical protein
MFVNILQGLGLEVHARASRPFGPCWMLPELADKLQKWAQNLCKDKTPALYGQK